MRCYRGSGGSGDGLQLPVSSLPPLEDFESIWLNQPDGQSEKYRREGDLLVYVESRQVVYYRGGPFDGQVRVDDDGLRSQPGPFVIPIPGAPGKYAWYSREDATLVYGQTLDESEMCTLDEYIDARNRALANGIDDSPPREG